MICVSALRLRSALSALRLRSALLNPRTASVLSTQSSVLCLPGRDPHLPVTPKTEPPNVPAIN
ncbi:MAG: hypothetical protein JWO56_1862 [Acidobacteria bacterium]|nr:hypothetical protein [Acidobacteriota bacterium]